MVATCPNCAAPVGEPDQRHCAFCGVALPRDEPAAAPRSRSTAELLAEVEGHPDLARWLTHRPSTRNVDPGPASMMSLGLLFAGVAAATTLVTLLTFPPFAVFPLLFAGVGGVMALVGGTRAARLARAPLVRVPALIADERTEVRGGARSSASTRYFTTLEDREGHREEYVVGAPLAGEVAPGDYGLAFLRGGWLVDFRRAGSR